MSRFSRRDFLKTASAATLAALAAGAPRLFAESEPQEKINATADTLIILWMAGGMAHTETFDPKRYTPFEKGMAVEQGAVHVSVDRDERRWREDQPGTGKHRQGNGSRHADPHLQRGGPREDSSLATSISLAHRLRPAADRGGAAHGGVDRQSIGAQQSHAARVHRYRTAAGSGRRRRTQGVSHRRLSRQRVRAVHGSRAGAGGGDRASAERDQPVALSEPGEVSQGTRRAKPHRRERQRLSEGISSPFA